MKEIVSLIWDDYTPQVEAQIIRDMIAVQSSSGNRIPDIKCVCGPEAYRALTGLGIPIVEGPVTQRITYQTQSEPLPQHFDDDVQLTIRVLYVAKKEFELDDNPRAGYYMKPQGRVTHKQMRQIMPNHSGPTNPAVIYLWGSDTPTPDA